MAFDLLIWRQNQIAALRNSGAEMFLGLPEIWMDDPHFFCRNGHISTTILKTDRGDKCLACGEPVLLGPDITEEHLLSLMTLL